MHEQRIMNKYLTIVQFIRLLSDQPAEKTDDVILRSAFEAGWIESQDLSDPGRIVRRIDAARITHLYLLHVKCMNDIEDISGAGVLMDLYDCRICVNHIAQVYLRGLMNGVCLHSGKNQSLIFDSQSLAEKADLLDILYRIRL